MSARSAPPGDPIVALTPAPVKDDWRTRDANVAFLESRAGRVSADPLTPRILSAEYLQRYRERGDVGDALRAEREARRSLAAMRHGNVAGEAALAAALLTLHRFAEAETAVDAALHAFPDSAELRAQKAGIALERGRVEEARQLVDRHADEAAFESVAARLDEETGRLDEARHLAVRAMHRADAVYDTPAERRAWLHARAGELAFESGDHAGARRAARDALAIFPHHLRALALLARVELADGRFAAAAAAASDAAARAPSPEALGILGDAQDVRGNRAAAAAARDEIGAIERIGNAEHLNDRLIAVWEADHGVRPADAYAIARRELAVRDDVYADDTLAWAAFADGRLDEAQRAARRALRYGTQDARMAYHAGAIAARAGNLPEARRLLGAALALDPRFAYRDADRARSLLASISRTP